MLISRTGAALAATLIALAPTGCSDDGEKAPTTTGVRHHQVADLCGQLDHSRLEKLTGTPAKFGPSRLPETEKIQRCSIVAATLTDPLGSSPGGYVQISSQIFESEAEAQESRPDTTPTNRGDAVQGLLDGVGDHAWFTYTDGPDEPGLRPSYQLTAQEGDALIMVNLMLNSATPVERGPLEEICRTYAEEALTLMRD